MGGGPAPQKSPEAHTPAVIYITTRKPAPTQPTTSTTVAPRQFHDSGGGHPVPPQTDPYSGARTHQDNYNQYQGQPYTGVQNTYTGFGATENYYDPYQQNMYYDNQMMDQVDYYTFY